MPCRRNVDDLFGFFQNVQERSKSISVDLFISTGSTGFDPVCDRCIEERANSMNNNICAIDCMFDGLWFQDTSFDPCYQLILWIIVLGSSSRCSHDYLLKAMTVACCRTILHAKQLPKQPLPPSTKIFFPTKLIQNYNFKMGSGQSQQQQRNNPKAENGQWMRYQLELEKDKPSQIQPFRAKEMTYLQELFTSLDKKNLKSLEIKDLQQITYLHDHPLFPRIRELFEEQMRKTKAKRINFELFLYLLSVFHARTEVEEKYKYIFRLYDTDKNMKIDSGDLTKIYRMIYTAPWMQEEDYSKLVTETLIKYGNKGQIRLENLRELVPEDEVREFLSFRFNNKFA